MARSAPKDDPVDHSKQPPNLLNLGKMSLSETG
jgi:hypothetical protein